ncbi:MAG: PIG-L family deacetylase [Planctomycetes bacterium]|nr:PIG-L family deacetylase [Planctomycetota bacterium]
MTGARLEHRFPPLLPKEQLHGPVLVLAAHPDDEVIACGGMLAWHASAGHRVVVVHATDGARGDPDGRFGDVAALRRDEGREALRRLGVTEVQALGFPDGELPEHAAALSARLRAIATAIRPATLYSFWFTESHRDHQALALALAGVHDAFAADCRCLLFGVNQVVAGGTLFDVGAFEAQKQDALSAFTSQLAYNDWREKILHRDHSMTVNVEDPAIQYAEVFADLRPGDLTAACARAQAALAAVRRGPA